MNDRIKLAEAMGWELKDAETYSFVDSSKKNYRKQWYRPDGITHSTIKLPDPENDANDCEALIRWLEKSHLVWITINFGCGQQTAIHAWNDDVEFKWSGDNWKQGVCELALKVIG